MLPEISSREQRAAREKLFNKCRGMHNKITELELRVFKDKCDIELAKALLEQGKKMRSSLPEWRDCCS